MVQVEDDLPTFISINFRGIKHINAMDLNWFLIELDGKKIDMNELQIIIRGGYRAHACPMHLLQFPKPFCLHKL